MNLDLHARTARIRHVREQTGLDLRNAVYALDKAEWNAEAAVVRYRADRDHYSLPSETKTIKVFRCSEHQPETDRLVILQVVVNGKVHVVGARYREGRWMYDDTNALIEVPLACGVWTESLIPEIIMTTQSNLAPTSRRIEELYETVVRPTYADFDAYTKGTIDTDALKAQLYDLLPLLFSGDLEEVRYGQGVDSTKDILVLRCFQSFGSRRLQMRYTTSLGRESGSQYIDSAEFNANAMVDQIMGWVVRHHTPFSNAALAEHLAGQRKGLPHTRFFGLVVPQQEEDLEQHRG